LWGNPLCASYCKYLIIMITFVSDYNLIVNINSPQKRTSMDGLFRDGRAISNSLKKWLKSPEGDITHSSILQVYL